MECEITPTFKFYIVIILKKCILFLSVLTDRLDLLIVKSQRGTRLMQKEFSVKITVPPLLQQSEPTLENVFIDCAPLLHPNEPTLEIVFIYKLNSFPIPSTVLVNKGYITDAPLTKKDLGMTKEPGGRTVKGTALWYTRSWVRVSPTFVDKPASSWVGKTYTISSKN